jgi:hypothetical protein
MYIGGGLLFLILLLDLGLRRIRTPSRGADATHLVGAS